MKTNDYKEELAELIADNEKLTDRAEKAENAQTATDVLLAKEREYSSDLETKLDEMRRRAEEKTVELAQIQDKLQIRTVRVYCVIVVRLVGRTRRRHVRVDNL